MKDESTAILGAGVRDDRRADHRDPAGGSVPHLILDALSRLNEHARAQGFGRKAIYKYKTLAAAECATEVVPIRIGVKCHRCDGTGIYRDWDGYSRGSCWGCDGHGIAQLRFIESRIGDFRWHHPLNAGGSDVLNAVWGTERVEYPAQGPEIYHLRDGSQRELHWREAEGWGPNMPGAEQLTADEACRLLNLVENWLRDWREPGRDRWTRYRRERALQEMLAYTVALEREIGACFLCGAAETINCHCIGQEWIAFSRPMCAACHGGGDKLRWPTEPNRALLTEHVRAWLAQPERQGKRHRADVS